jgi:hypothetical protein
MILTKEMKQAQAMESSFVGRWLVEPTELLGGLKPARPPPPPKPRFWNPDGCGFHNR